MADSEKRERAGGEGEEEEEQRLLMEGVTVLDFDMLCSTVALQTQGKWRKLESGDCGGDDEGLELGGGVFRMWEGAVLDCFEDRRIALQSSWLVLVVSFFLSMILLLFSFCLREDKMNSCKLMLQFSVEGNKKTDLFVVSGVLGLNSAHANRISSMREAVFFFFWFV